MFLMNYDVVILVNVDINNVNNSRRGFGGLFSKVFGLKGGGGGGVSITFFFIGAIRIRTLLWSGFMRYAHVAESQRCLLLHQHLVLMGFPGERWGRLEGFGRFCVLP